MRSLQFRLTDEAQIQLHRLATIRKPSRLRDFFRLPHGDTMARLPRFKRAPTVVPIELTERDRDIIRLVHRHRFLRSPQITALLGGSSQQLLRRLQSLYHHG